VTSKVGTSSVLKEYHASSLDTPADSIVVWIYLLSCLEPIKGAQYGGLLK
jgi:hypothetical protein